MLGLGTEELLLTGLLGLFMFSPAEMVRGIRKLQLWRITAESWVRGMWAGWSR